MKILLGNNSYDWMAGSETWMYTLGAELLRRGHQVTAYSPQLGFMATKMEALGIGCVSEIAVEKRLKSFDPMLTEEEGGYDIIICAHYAITRYLHERLAGVPIIAVCHGVLHDGPQGEILPEHPVTEFAVDQYIAVSEEVQTLLKQRYDIDSLLLRNFFDLERFKKEGKLPDKPKTFLVNSNYWGVDDDINKIIREVAQHYDARFLGIGANFSPCFEVEQIVGEADVVFGMGRSVQEAACMGKLAVVHGRWGTGGVITPESYPKLKLTNFSGRPIEEGRYTPLLSAEEIIADIDANFNQKNVDAVYRLFKKDHNVSAAADMLLGVANSLIAK